MKQRQVENTDFAMRMHTIKNGNAFPIMGVSQLEKCRPDLIEHEEFKKFILHPGQLKIVPHEYFSYFVVNDQLQIDTTKNGLPITIHFGPMPKDFSQVIRYNFRKMP